MTRWLWPGIIVCSAVGVCLLLLLNTNAPIRPLLAFWFFLVCPGMAFVRLLRLANWIVEATLAVALSLALDLLVSTTLVYAGEPSPSVALTVLVGVSLIGVAIDIQTSASAKKTAPLWLSTYAAILSREWRNVE